MRGYPIFTRYSVLIFFSGLFLWSLYLSYHAHADNGYFNWKSELWADKAGYYIYLPATVFFGFDPDKAPTELMEKTGYGFWLDREGKAIKTKYPYGVSLLLSPFFLGTHLISILFHIPEEGGFSPLYHYMVNFAAIVYAILGLWLVWMSLLRYLPVTRTHTTLLLSFLTIICLYAGTNLFYYTIYDSGMSHVYSFFIFSLFFYSLLRYVEFRKYKWFLLMVFAGALALVTRPTNFLLFSLFFFWDVGSWRGFIQRIRLFFSPVNLATFIFVFILVIFPQLVYWKTQFGSWIHYSYGGEGFINWNSPYLIEVWFAPLNGLLLYVPIAGVMLTGMLLMMINHRPNGWLLLGIFIVVSYMCASWETWYFGCSFSQRSFVEYYALFAVSLWYLVLRLTESGKFLKIIFTILLLLASSWYTLSLTKAYEKCFFGSTWDWNQFGSLADRAGIPFPANTTNDFCNDFENSALYGTSYITSESSHSGRNSASFNESHEFCCSSYKMAGWFDPLDFPTVILAEFWVRYPVSVSGGVRIVFSVEEEDRVIEWKSAEITNQVSDTDVWNRISTGFSIPDSLSPDTRLRVYMWNPKRVPIYVDDMVISYK